MTQVDNVSVRARSTDPETSHQAAFAFESDQAKCAASVSCAVAILAKHGPLTDFELLDLWPQYWLAKYSHTLPQKARHWARERGLVKHDGYGLHQGRRVRRYSIGQDREFLLGPWKPSRKRAPTWRQVPSDLETLLGRVHEIHRTATRLDSVGFGGPDERLQIIAGACVRIFSIFAAHGIEPTADL